MCTTNAGGVCSGKKSFKVLDIDFCTSPCPCPPDASCCL
jgi:hypothetical protein